MNSDFSRFLGDVADRCSGIAIYEFAFAKGAGANTHFDDGWHRSSSILMEL